MSTRHALLRTGLALGLTASSPVLADALHPKMDAQFFLDAGAYAPSVRTVLRVDGSEEIGTELSLEDDLAFEDSPILPTLLLNLRLGERWRIEAEYLPLLRDQKVVYDGDPLDVGDITIPTGASVAGHFGSDTYRLSAGYSLLKTPRSELGAVLGVHATEFDLRLAATLVDTSVDERDVLLPLPTMGLYGNHALSPKWLLSGRVDLFSMDYRQYTGHLLNASASLDYQFARHLSLGVGFRRTNLRLEVDETVDPFSKDFSGRFHYTYSGPTLAVSLMF